MLNVWNDMQETRARLGAGSALYSTFFNEEGKYQLLCPTVETPFVGSDVAEVEIKVSSSGTVGKINGVETLNAAETPVYMHRDVIKLLEEISGKTIDLLSMAGDFTGYKYTGVITYTPSNATTDDAWQGTIKITPKTKPVFVENCYPLVIPTAHFTSGIEAVVELATTTGKYETTIETKPTDTTIEATSASESIATATVTGKKLTITGVAEGSTIITLETQKEGYASWKTSILVIVPKAVAGETD